MSWLIRELCALNTYIYFKQVLKLEIPSTPGFTFVNFLSDAGDVREWNLQGLPADAFSTENGVMVTRSNRWPLMIDPQVTNLHFFSNIKNVFKKTLSQL